MSQFASNMDGPSFSPHLGVLFTRKSEVPAYLRSGEFFQSLSDEDDEQISVPSNVLKTDTSIENNADMEHLLCTLRFWGVSELSNEVIKFCLSNNDSHTNQVLQSFVHDFPYIKTLAAMLPLYGEPRIRAAIQSGFLEIVQNLPAQEIAHAEGCTVAAEAGHLHILKFLHEQGLELDECVLVAALHGRNSLPCVQYLHAQGVEWLPDSLSIALKAGNRDIFHYALQNGCAWEEAGIDRMSRDDAHVEALRYAVHHGYPLHYSYITLAAGKGAIQCLQVLHEANCPWDAGACSQAASNGNLDCLRYLHEHGCPWDSDTLLSAVARGRTDCVQYALQHGCAVPFGCCATAAGRGSLLILQYLHEAGVPWDASVCVAAAQRGHLDCLRYAHENGCPWTVDTVYNAARYGHLACLQYAHEHGCPLDQAAYGVALQGQQLQCAEYIRAAMPLVAHDLVPMLCG